MGYKDKKKYRMSLKEQLNKKLSDMLKKGVGTSKKIAVKTGTDYNKIFSYNTYNTYSQHCKYFIEWIEKVHPECTNLKSCRKYVNEWLEYRTSLSKTDKEGNVLRDENGNPIRKYSAWTLQTEAKALGKLYGIKPTDKRYFHAPKRERSDIIRSRGEKAMDRKFSEANNWDLVCFAKSTGLRRNVLERLKGSDFFTREELEKLHEIYSKIEIKGNDKEMMLKASEEALKTFPDMQNFVLSYRDKGGKTRFSPIYGKHADRAIERLKDTPKDQKVWEYIPLAMDVHSYRGDYATALYKHYARDIDDIPYDKVNKGTKRRYQSEVFTCRGEEKGKKLDKMAMKKTSIALGHNRIEIISRHYLKGL